MFEIGFPELVLIAIVGLLVLGPERLPEALRTLGLWLGRMRRSFTAVKAEIEKEIGMDEVKRQLHNEAIMEEMKRIEAEVKTTADSARSTLNEGMTAAQTPSPSIDPGIDSQEADSVANQPQHAEESGQASSDEAQPAAATAPDSKTATSPPTNERAGNG